MSKKAIIVSVVVLLLVVGGIAWLALQREPEVQPVAAMKAVPIDVAFLFETQQAYQLLENLQKGNEVWPELTAIKEFGRFDDMLKQVKQAIPKEGLKAAFQDSPGVVSFHIRGKYRLESLFLSNVIGSKTVQAAEQALERNLKPHGKLTQKIYSQVTIYRYQPNDPNELAFSYAFEKGIFFLSPSAILLEEAIRQLDTNVSILTYKAFQRVQSSAGANADVNLYVQYKKLAEVADKIVNAKGKGFLHALKNFASWSETDIKIRDNALLMSGFVTPANEFSNYMQVLVGQEAVDVNLHRYFPEQLAGFIYMGIANNTRYFADYRKHLNSTGNIHGYKHKLKTIERELKVNAEGIFEEILDKELATVFLNPGSQGRTDSHVSLLQVHDKKEALKALMPMLKGFARHKGIELSTLISEHPGGKAGEEKQLVYRMPVSHILSVLFGLGFDRSPANYFSFYDNIMVLGRSQSAVLSVIKQMEEGPLLTRNQAYKAFNQALVSSANFYFYVNISQAADWIPYFMEPQAAAYFNDHLDVFSKFEAFGLQYTADNEQAYNTAYLKFNPKTRLFKSKVWEQQLEASVRQKPWLVKNHYTGDHEILVQDVNNKLYLIDPSGQVLWEKPLDEPIMGEVIQIDYYQNDKLQMLFNTASAIYLLDRNGESVADYPVPLPFPATNGLSCFDYNGTGEYRIFIGLGNTVKLYDKQGSEITGWQFGEAQSEVHTPVQHVRLGNKDYILFSDHDRIYMLHRRGTERVTPEAPFAVAPNSQFYLQPTVGNQPAHLVTSDSQGRIVKQFFDGSQKSLDINLPDEHYFVAEDLTGDQVLDFVILQGKQLRVLQSNGELLFEHTFKQAPVSRAVVYDFGGGAKKIGVTVAQTNTLYLFDAQGQLHQSFPLAGYSPFSIGFLEKGQRHFSLITGSDTGVVHYQLK